MSELRKDPITGRWVIFATEFRQNLSTLPQTGTPTATACPFCTGYENFTPQEILAYRPSDTTPNDTNWKIRIVPNKYPVLRVEGQLDARAEGMYDKLNGIGANEILIESQQHLHDLNALPVEHVEQIFNLLRDRFLDLKKDARIQYLQAFRNYGELAGANLAHPHMQLIGLPLIPKLIVTEMDGLRRYHSFHQRCIYCDIIRQDAHTPERLISENDFFVALTPYASRVPFEVWILPKQHRAHFMEISKPELQAYASITQDVLSRYKRVLNDPAYNWFLHTAPLQTSDQALFHWHTEFIPRLARFTGFEWSTDYYINPTLPEEAAKFLRAAGG